MATEHDLQPHQETFVGFCKVTKYSTISIVVVLALMAAFLV